MTAIAASLAWAVRGLVAVFVCAFLLAAVGVLVGVGWLMSDTPEDH